jgi:PTS system nitrogen regulatory IIA component
MRLDEIFLLNDTLNGLDASSKRQVLTEAAAKIAASRELDPRAVFDVLHERERLGSTAFGGGVALPHGKVPGLPALAGCITRLEKPIPFEAADNEPVDLVITLLAPDTGGAEHLRVLARLSRMLRDDATVAQLRAAQTDEALWSIITAADEQRAAA